MDDPASGSLSSRPSLLPYGPCRTVVAYRSEVQELERFRSLLDECAFAVELLEAEVRRR